MEDENAYWSALSAIVMDVRCRVRLGYDVHGSKGSSHWGQLLIVPVPGSLESCEGPVPFRHVEWVEISTLHVEGGALGQPRRMVDITEDILAKLRATDFEWEMHDSTWSLAGRFDDEPVRVIRIVNPFRLS